MPTQIAPTRARESGQALVVVLLILSVVLTIALSIASRSVTDITISKKEEDALRAVSAAEAGVEQLLKTGAGTTIAGSLPVGSTFNASISGLAQGTQEFAFPTGLRAGDTTSIWFVSHDTGGNLVCTGALPCFTGDRIKICWGNPGTSGSSSTAPALEFSLLHTSGSGGGSTAKIGRAAYDPNSSRRTDNNFADASGSCTIDNRSFAFSKEFTLSSIGASARGNNTSLPGPQTGRVRFFYNTDIDHVVGISVNFPGNGVLPQQGNKIESLGTAGEAKRKVVVYRPYADIPPIFDFGLYSGAGDLSK
ncbi:MAG: hypothetical protein AAB599_01090 [Patescibacteria group bacterium]